MKGSFAFVGQKGKMDCGPCCLQMVALGYGKSFTLSQIRRWADTGRDGTSLQGMENAAKRMGFDTLPARLSIDKLADKRVIPLPAILLWGGKHYVVLTEIRSRNFLLADPASGVRSWSQNDFLKLWADDNREGIALFLEPL